MFKITELRTNKKETSAVECEKSNLQVVSWKNENCKIKTTFHENEERKMKEGRKEIGMHLFIVHACIREKVAVILLSPLASDDKIILSSRLHAFSARFG